MELESWCPVCDKQIEPKRYQVPVYPPQPKTTAPPPSPESSPSRKDSKRKVPNRTRGGLVQGTGRMKPNGTIKPQQVQPTKVVPIRYRTVIDQSPLPLYCSEECRRMDDRDSAGSMVESSDSSIPSDSSLSTASSAAEEQSDEPKVYEYASPSIALLAKMYNFPPAPPPAPITFADAKPRNSRRLPDIDSGMMLAGRYMTGCKSASPDAPKPKSSSTSSNASTHSRAASPSSQSKPRKERSILPPGLEGRLLVPDIKLKVRTCSSASVTPRVRSPLSASDSGDDKSTTTKKSKSSRRSRQVVPEPETRSWSWDSFKTYEMMPFPSKKEKRTEVQMVDGKETTVEVEVDVPLPLKRLFLFPPTLRAS